MINVMFLNRIKGTVKYNRYIQEMLITEGYFIIIRFIFIT